MNILRTFLLILLTTNILHADVTTKAIHKPKFNHLIIAPSEAVVSSIRFPGIDGHIFIVDVQILNSKAYSALIDPLIGKDIDSNLITQIALITQDYIKKSGHDRVSILLPNQNVSNGDIKFVVVVGHYNLARLVISNSEQGLSMININKSIEQVILDNMPAVLNSRESAMALSPFFGKPITAESVNKIILLIAGLVEKSGSHLAGAQVPSQSAENGDLRIAMEIGTYPLKRIVVSSKKPYPNLLSEDELKHNVVAINLQSYATKQFESCMQKYIKKPITVELVNELSKAIITYGTQHDLVLVATTAPVLDLNTGEIRFGVTTGHYNQLHFKGNRWFSDELLQKKLGISPGDEIKVSNLDNAINWANKNPFRHIEVQADTSNQLPGLVDIDVAINEQFPVKITASYNNSGNTTIGTSQYSTSLQFGNLWGLDQEMIYQYATSNLTKVFQSHNLDYKIPTKWKDFFRISATLAHVNPQALFGEQGFNENGRNIIADLRYLKPIVIHNWNTEFSAGIDYKQVTTNLEFFTQTLPVASYDIAQFTAGITSTHTDTKGEWILALTCYVSPGDLNLRNSQNSFGNNIQGGQTGRSSRYEYAILVLQRETNLPFNTQWVSRAELQFSSTNLQGSEELTVGGISTVRGYQEVISGDQGLVINEELRGPVWTKKIPFVPKKWRSLYYRLLAFYDYGNVAYKHPSISSVKLSPLMSSGIGLRSSIGDHFSTSMDYGWQLLTHTNTPEPIRGFASIQASLSF